LPVIRPTWRARVSLFVWLLPFEMFGFGDPTVRYAATGSALPVTESRKLPQHVKVSNTAYSYIPNGHFLL